MYAVMENRMHVCVQCYKELGFISITTCFHDRMGRTVEKTWAQSHKEREKRFSTVLIIQSDKH